MEHLPIKSMVTVKNPCYYGEVLLINFFLSQLADEITLQKACNVSPVFEVYNKATYL